MSIWSRVPLEKNPVNLNCSSWKKSSGYNEDLDCGARALEAFVRPFPLFVPGTPTWIDFDLLTVTFEARFTQSEDYNGNEYFELFLPSIHFRPATTQIVTSGGTHHWDESIQRLYWLPKHSKTTPYPEISRANGKVSNETISHFIKIFSTELVTPLTREIQLDGSKSEAPAGCPACSLM